MQHKKIIKCLLLTLFSLMLFFAIILGEAKKIVAVSSISGIIMGILLPEVKKSWVDYTDVTNWQESIRKLLRGGILKKDDYIRISFAYLFRIKIDNQYLLIKSSRGTQKFQPIGGAYKFKNPERRYLSNQFSIINDDMIPLDNSSKNDYRLRVPVKYLKKFVERFDETSCRENISDLSREFKEELVSSGIVNFSEITYQYCGRHFTNIEYSKYFKCYELLLADIVELCPTNKQIIALKKLMNEKSDAYIFATDSEIESCGVKAGTNQLLENVADHSYKILQITNEKLIRNEECGKIYTISLL